MAVKVNNKKFSQTAWGDVDKAALGSRLAELYAAGGVSRAVIREVYGYVPDDAFGTDGAGKPTFAYSKAFGAHHELSGNAVVVNRGGVQALAGALAGARAEPNLDAAAMGKAKAHARKHYRAMGDEEMPDGIRESLRQVGRGKALVEVKGSYGYLIAQVRSAFRKQFPFYPDWDSYWVLGDEVFDTYVIVTSDDLPQDEYYYVTYESDGTGSYTFANRDQWEVVELAYNPATSMAESRRSPKGKRFVEQSGAVTLLTESAEDGRRRIRAVGITADVVNGNGRRYPAAVLRAAVEQAKTHLHESLGQGRYMLLGEAEHPDHKPTRRPSLTETVVCWDELDFDDRQVLLEGTIIETSKGKDILALMEGGVMPGTSQRGYGESRLEGKGDGRVEVITDLVITGYDLVLEPSDASAGVTYFESQEDQSMNPEDVLRVLQESGFFDQLTGTVRKQVEEAMAGRDAALKESALRSALGIGPEADITEAVLRLAQQRGQPAAGGDLDRSLRESLGLADTDNLSEALKAKLTRARELEEAEQERATAAYVEAQVATIKYPDWLKKQFGEAVLAAKPRGEEAAKRVLVEKRREYDAIMAGLELASRGMPGMRMLGSVLESETGTPEFARASHMLTEAMVNAGRAPARKWNRQLVDMSPGERLAKKVLERFDELYGNYLLQESALVEAEQVSDLNLPYSVARAVIAEAVPNLVAASIFDVTTTDQAPSRLYYEVYAGESGSTATVTNEAVTLTALDTWYALANKRQQPGTVVVKDTTLVTTYVEGDDYAIDYANGQVRGITGGGITAGDVVKVTYTYDAVRKGELAAIERAKLTLAYKTLEILADRLATEISTEVVVFSRSQLSWDATGRTLAGLVRKIQEIIDRGMLYMGLGVALSVANNSGGTWSATPGGTATYDENLDILFRYVGVAKVKVANRYYEPTFILCSVTNGDLVSNSKQFSAAGMRPDMDINAAGFVGRVKGLPVFQSTLFTDEFILVGNRELVMHRIFRPMVLKGPYPSYSSNKLVGSEQYYAEEFNGTDAPVPKKGAFVKLTA
jgi:hypothetical protein